MEKHLIDLLESYLNGALMVENTFGESEHMKGYSAAMRNVKEFLKTNKEHYGLTSKED